MVHLTTDFLCFLTGKMEKEFSSVRILFIKFSRQIEMVAIDFLAAVTIFVQWT